MTARPNCWGLGFRDRRRELKGTFIGLPAWLDGSTRLDFVVLGLRVWVLCSGSRAFGSGYVFINIFTDIQG